MNIAEKIKDSRNYAREQWQFFLKCLSNLPLEGYCIVSNSLSTGDRQPVAKQIFLWVYVTCQFSIPLCKMKSVTLYNVLSLVEASALLALASLSSGFRPPVLAHRSRPSSLSQPCWFSVSLSPWLLCLLLWAPGFCLLPQPSGSIPWAGWVACFSSPQQSDPWPLSRLLCLSSP